MPAKVIRPGFSHLVLYPPSSRPSQKLDFSDKAYSKLISKYVLGQCIGEGTSSLIYLAFLKNFENSKKFAVKKLVSSFSDSKELIQFAHKEFKLLKKLSHPNVVKSKEFFADFNFGVCYTVLEFCGNLDLKKTIEKKLLKNEVQASLIFSQITSALAYLHFNHIVHRDIKPANLMIKPFLPSTLIPCSVTIIDFNCATSFLDPGGFEPHPGWLSPPQNLLKQNKSLLKIEQTALLTPTGTEAYRAPEVTGRLALNSQSEKMDIWSLGVTLHEMATGELPAFVNREISWPKENLFSQRLSFSLVFLVTSMLKEDPELRPSALEVLENMWVSCFGKKIENNRRISCPEDFNHGKEIVFNKIMNGQKWEEKIEKKKKKSVWQIFNCFKSKKVFVAEEVDFIFEEDISCQNKFSSMTVPNSPQKENLNLKMRSLES